MIVTVDIGNSYQDYALFTDDEKFISRGQLSDLKKDIKKFDNVRIIASSVNDEFLKEIPGRFERLRNFRINNAFIDMPTKYAVTMGEDRLAVCYYLYKLDHQSKVVVDSGTFTTIDFITIDGHQGGYIIPGKKPTQLAYKRGINLREHVSNKTSQLTKEIPVNTEAAIEQGALATYLFPIKGLIKQHQYNNIFITGGSGEEVANFLKSSKEDFQIRYSRELVHRSLCYIAKRNLK